MLGEILYEEKGKTTGLRVLSSENGEVRVEVSLQTEGRILGVGEKSIWTYLSKTRSDGSIYGEGKGVMTTQAGDVIHLTGHGAASGMGSDGSIKYRGAVYFHTTSAKFSKLNGIAGVHEYNVGGDGATSATVWEWK
jgi:hypothetical protein